MKTKTIFTVLVAAILTFHTSMQISSAEGDSYTVWNEMMSATSKLFVDGNITEDENTQFQAVLSMGNAGETEDAVRALNKFLKDHRNTVLRDLARGAMTELMKQRQGNAKIVPRRAAGEHSCPPDMKVCPNGTTLVSREGPNCAFSDCPQ